ncbi:MAG: transcriptional repressor [Bacteroidales bacterium]|nr:transcriptional repressor [Bacteroidales bacterium]
MLDLDRFKLFLHDRNLKATPQRLAVHRAMIELGHACADTVADHIRLNTDIRISDASVYNILSQLAKMGVYRYLLSSNNKLYFDVNTKRHAHLYDRVNHEFRDLCEDGAIELMEKHFRGRRWRGYKFEGIEINLVCRPSRSSFPKNR